MQDGVGHRQLVCQNSTSATLSSLPSRTTKTAPAGPTQIQNFWKQQAALDTFCPHMYENKNQTYLLKCWVEVQHQLLTLIFVGRSHEQASVLFWDRIQRQICLSSIFSKYPKDISKPQFSPLTLIFSPVFQIWGSKSAYFKETEFWFYWQFSLTQFTCCCYLCYCIRSCFSIKHPNSQPPKNTPLQIHLLSWLNKLQLQKVFFSWDFFESNKCLLPC